MFAGILLCIQLMLLLIMHIPAVKRYGREFSKPLSGEFRVLIFPAALFLLDLAGHKYSSFYERKLKVKLGELGGGKNINVCIRLFIGWKLTLLWIAVMGLTASAAVVEVDSAFLVFGVLISAVAFILPDRQLENRIKK